MTTNSKDKQKVWPLFGLAGGLVAFGFWYLFAFPVRAPVESTALPSPFLEQAAPPTKTEEIPGAVELRYGEGERRFALDLRQSRESEGGSVDSRIALTVHDRPLDEAEKGQLAFERRYEEPTVQLADDEIVGRAISAEVERLLENSAHRVVIDPSGEVLSTTLISSESAQLRQTLVLIRDAMALLRPRFPREPVRAGEEWSWTLPVVARPRDPEDESRVTGTIDLTARVVGAEARGVVIEASLSSGHEGTVIVDDEEAHEFTSRGEGSASVVWSPEKREIVESVASQTQTTKYADRTVQTKHSLRLVAE